MMEELYYMLVGFALIFFFFIFYFSEYEMIKHDKHGREWNASIFIIVPLSLLNLILCILLTYESWNVQAIEFTGSTPIVHTFEDLGYLSIVFFALALFNVAFIIKSVFEFFVNSVEG